MKITKKILISALAISPLTTLAFIPSVVRNNKTIDYCKNFYYSKKENSCYLTPEVIKIEDLNEEIVRNVPFWVILEKADRFYRGGLYFSKYGDLFRKLFPNEKEKIKDNWLSLYRFCLRKINDGISEVSDDWIFSKGFGTTEAFNLENKGINEIFSPHNEYGAYWSITSLCDDSKREYIEKIKEVVKTIHRELENEMKLFLEFYRKISLKINLETDYQKQKRTGKLNY